MTRPRTFDATDPPLWRRVLSRAGGSRATHAPTEPSDADVIDAWLLDAGLARVPATEAHQGGSAMPPATLAAGIANLWTLGYAPDRELARAWADRDDGTCLAMTYALGASRLGGHRPMKPFYPNFPEQVATASDTELVRNALVHYAGDAIGVRIMPRYATRVGRALGQDAVDRPLGLGTPDRVADQVRTLVGRAAGLSAADRAVVGAWARTDADLLRSVLPTRFTNRENLSTVAAALALAGAPNDLDPQIASATDVLRLAVCLNGGDPSLADPTRLRLARRHRRWLLTLLDGLPVIDLWGRPERFKRLGESLHPGEHAHRHPRAAAAFADLRAGRRQPTLLTHVEHAQAVGDVQSAARLLAVDRPGELGRRLDALVRRSDDPGDLVATFAASADRMSTRVLLTVLGHFAHRPEVVGSPRVFLARGGAVCSTYRADDRAPISADTCTQIAATARAALVRRFATLPPLGAVWVDPQVASLTVPLSIRTASAGLHTLGRGSRLPVDEPADVLRLFLWWRDQPRARVDLDLSVALLDEAMDLAETVSYYHLRTDGSLHSGDITSAPAPDGAAEFVDVDLARLRSRGLRYAVAVVTSYTGQAFGELDGVFAGVQARADRNAGEVFEPSRVALRFDVASASRFVVPLVVDLAGRQIVWTDVGLAHDPTAVIDVAQNAVSLRRLVGALLAARPVRLDELFEAHVAARGRWAASPDGADLVIGPGGDVDPVDAAAVLTDWVVEP